MEFIRELKGEENIMTEKGVIKLFNQLEGYGFITDSKKKDVFFHRNYLRGSKKEPKTGDQVLFIREPGPKGPRAKFWAFTKEQTVYRVLYKRHIDDNNWIVFSTGTVDRIIHPTNFEQIRFQNKTESGWLECSDPRLLDESA